MVPNENRDRADIPFPPPLIFFAVLALGSGLEYVFPTRPIHSPRAGCIITGLLLAVGAGILAAAAFAALLRNKTTFNPSKPTTTIVRSGPFRFSRNPLYLALVLLHAGIAAGCCSLWLFCSSLVLLLILDVVVVRREEDYLSRKFGETYLMYKATVRRWL
ncbi:MAG TPA: isoprenylcysteine carboxylmethyltransferase family protein [Nitrospirota bacterium]|nr:isoprenylcysteine carboxylmethyltransferase family protein [Nitrospirota bacterium]